MAKMETFQDDFTTLDTAKWDSYGDVSIVDGQLRLRTATSSGYHGIYSHDKAGGFDLTGSYLLTAMLDITNPQLDGLETEFYASSMVNDGRIGFVMSGYYNPPTINAVRRSTGGSTTWMNSQTWNKDTHKWLRIRESGGTVYWEYANQAQYEAGTWQLLDSYATASLFDLTNVAVDYVNGNWQNESARSSAFFDDMNILPPGPEPPGSMGNMLLLF